MPLSYSRHVIKKCAQWFHGITPKIVELVNEYLSSLVRNCCGRDWWLFVCKEISIIRWRQLHAQVCILNKSFVEMNTTGGVTFKRLALCQVGVVRLCQKSCLVTSHNSLEESCRYLGILSELFIYTSNGFEYWHWKAELPWWRTTEGVVEHKLARSQHLSDTLPNLVVAYTSSNKT